MTVTSSFERAQAELATSSPGIKKIIKKNGRDVVILVDKGLKVRSPPAALPSHPLPLLLCLVYQEIEDSGTDPMFTEFYFVYL